MRIIATRPLIVGTVFAVGLAVVALSAQPPAAPAGLAYVREHYTKHEYPDPHAGRGEAVHVGLRPQDVRRAVSRSC